MKKFFRNFSLNFDRSFSKGFRVQVAWLVVIVVVAFVVLMVISSLGYEPKANTPFSQRCIDVIGLMMNPGVGTDDGMLSVFAIITSVVGLVVFGGMLISVMSNVLERRIESYQKGETTYALRDHVVVLGFNRSMPSLLEHIVEKHPGCYILLMCDRPVEEISDWLYAKVDGNVEEPLVLLNGSRTAADDIARLSLCNGVREIFVIGEENEPDHDAANMRCAELIAEAMLPLPEAALADKVPCHVQIDSQLMFGILQKVGLKASVTRNLNVLPFSFHDIWAQNVLATCPDDAKTDDAAEPLYRPFDGDGITADSPRHVHLIIVGMTEMGRALATNAAHVLHFPNYREGDQTCASRITFIDPAAGYLGRAFRTFYEALFGVARWRTADASCPDAPWRDPLADSDSDSPYRYQGDHCYMDTDWEFIEGDAYEPHVQDYFRRAAADPNAIITVALCADDSDANALACQSLPEVLRNAALQVLVRQKESSTMMDLLRRRHGFESVRAFGMMTACYRENLVSDRFGKLINALYWGKDIAHDPAGVDEAWSACSPLDRWSSIYCANMLYYKLRSLGLDTRRELSEEEVNAAVAAHQDEIQPTEHNRWNTERLLLGYRPLFEDETAHLLHIMETEDYAAFKAQKKAWGKGEMKHFDICGNALLTRLDPKVLALDNTVNSALYTLYKMTRR